MILEWFEFQTQAPSISFWFRNKFPAVAICLVMGPAQKQIYCYYFKPILIINGNEEVCDNLFRTQRYCIQVFLIHGRQNSDYSDEKLLKNVWKRPRQTKLKDYLDETLLENEWNHVDFT